MFESPTVKVLQSQLEYWKQQLANSPPVIELPTDRPRPPAMTYSGIRQYLELPQDLTEALKALSQRQNVTLYMTLLAAFKILLYRYSGQSDIIVGSPIANRNCAETEDLIGVFVNTLVLRTDLEGNPSFLELLSRIREVTLDAYEHQDLPFQNLVEELHPEPSLSYHPLFQVMFVFQNTPQEQLELPLTLNPQSVESRATQFDLTLRLQETASGLKGFFEYSTDLFDAATIARMAGHFQIVLAAIVANPEQRIGELPLLTADERQQLLFEWNHTQADYPKDTCLQQLIEAQVEKTPTAIAVVFENQQLTYQELNTRANQLAHYLQSLSVGPDVLVGICVERSLEMVIGLLGILKAGGAYVPLDPGYPQERLAYMLADSQVAVLLTQQRLVDSLPQHSNLLVLLDADSEHIAQQSQENPISGTKADNLAYVIYTSGSTGKPKGVLVSHYNVVRLFKATEAWYNFNEQDVWTLFHSYAFDFSVWEIWGALIYGSRLVVVSYYVSRSPEDLYNLLISQGVTVLNQTPSAFRQLIRVDESSGTAKELNLRLVIFGGEALELQSLKPWFERHGDEFPQLVNMYGITETTVHVTYRPLTIADLTDEPPEDYLFNKPQRRKGHEERRERRSVIIHRKGSKSNGSVIGSAIPDLKLYILDQHQQPVPIGVSGEIYVGGAGVTQGYLNRPELTSERFIPNPFSNSLGERLYKTGDLARYLPNGDIEYLGRIDYQVKIRGFRIEIGEIETVLAQHPRVREVVVIVRESSGDKHLVAYVVPKTEQVPNDLELRRFLLQQLPDYMVPAIFTILEEVPLTPNGKVDRRALPAPDTNRSGCFGTRAPRTPTEEILAAIWAQVLGLEFVGIDDNFFTLGGHSLLATQVISRCRQAFCVEISLQMLFDAPTIALLADAIAKLSNAYALSSSEHEIIPQIENREQAPLSFAQQRLWFLEQLEPNNPTYLLPTALRLTGRLNVSVLQQSIDAIVADHEALRTNFISSDDGSPIQVIGEPRSIEMMLIDLTQLPHCDKQEQVQRLLNQEAQRPFDLASDLMLRATLLQIDQQEHILLLVMHHIASDGWSIGILWKQLAAVYEAFGNGLPSPLPKLPIQYADFAVWQRQWLQQVGANGSPLQTQLDYWKNQLTGANHVLELPTDRSRPPVQTYRGAKQSLILPQTLAASLKALSRQEGVTLFMTMLATFGTLLHRYTGQEDVNIGSPIAGRNRAEIEGLIGFFINTVVLRTNFSGHPSFRLLLSRVRQMALDAYAHQDMPFEKLVEELQLERDTSRNPLFQVWFNMLNLNDIQLELPGLEGAAIAMPEAASKFDLTLYVREQTDLIQLELVYNIDLFAPERMMEMLSQFHHLLIQVVENPDISIAALSLVTPKAKLLLPNPLKQLPLQSELPVLTSFKKQAQRVPQQVAVVDAFGSWTYSELNSRANQLANYLLANNLKSQDIVAIYGHRSATLVWAILGVLKAGAAFVILDPAYPASRLIDCLEIAPPRFMLQIPAAGELPTVLQEYVDLSDSCRLELQLDSILPQYATSDPTVTVEPDDLAYVAFTSGSTGKPKGIKGTHRPLSHFLQWHCQTFGLSESDKFSMLSGLSHDPLLRDIFTPLSLGATLCIPSQQDMETPGQLANWMRRERVSIAHLTPAMAQLLTTNTESNTTALRYLFFGGDVLTQQDLRRIRNFAPQSTCVNFYGATETPQAMGYFIVPNDCDRIFKEAIPLGRGIEDVQLLVLTNMLQLAGVGEIGEIYVRTPYLSQGYIGTEQLTQERFIINPLTKDAEDRLYKTGDLGRYLPDAKIEFLGRIDDQVKIRGFRIELGEIESRLRQYPGVQETVVIAHSDLRSDKYLVAYVVPKLEQVLKTKELRSFLWEKLPNYMIPSTFLMLDALPLTQNGKVDRLALPVPELVNLKAENTFVAPRNQLEQEMTQIWQQVLGIEPIGVRDNFFDLGGHSLLAVRLFAQIEKKFGTKIPLATLFASGTVEDLAQIICQRELAVGNQVLISEAAWRQDKSKTSWSSLVEIQPNGSQPPLFCIHPLGGEILCYRNLALHLGSQSVYGLQPQGLDGKQPPLTRVEDMASHYIQEIQTIQPHGPYFLAGYSFGGIVAFEMAQQLHKQGEKVDFLVMLDTCRPGSTKRSPFRKRIFLHLDNLLQLGPAYLWRKAVSWSNYSKYLLTNRYKRHLNVALDLWNVARHLPDTDKHLAIIDANVQALDKYIFQAYPGRITLLRTEDQNRDDAVGMQYDPQFGWGDLVAGGIDIHYVPGSHLSLLKEPYVRVVAEKLQACLT